MSRYIACVSGLLTTILLCLPMSVYAAERGESIQEGESITWHDGQATRVLTISPNLLMEFPRPDATESRISKLAPSATTLRSGRGMRLWQLDKNNERPTLSSLRSGNGDLRVSPVFYSQSGRMMALPGNIIVRFSETWDDMQIGNWEQQHGLQRVQVLKLKHSYYVYRTEPGLVALDLAEAIRKEGQVEESFPNWWKEISLR